MPFGMTQLRLIRLQRMSARLSRLETKTNGHSGPDILEANTVESTYDALYLCTEAYRYG